ncbi:MAG TPA: insulinase family protein, partial [Candidatus Eisenbacteria bacterium]|nr:insulinase family protein [Candidatus Eisenbacteria bacterium]
MRFSSVIVLASALALQLPSSVSAAPQLVRTLPNRMTLLVRENRTRPLVSIQVWVKAGSRDEQLQERGVSTVLARALFAGTKNRDQNKIAEELNRYGGSSGSEAGYAYTLLQVTVPARSFGLGLDVLSDVVLHPRFATRDVTQAVDLAKTESGNLLKAAERASINPTREALHPGTPLAWPLAVPPLELGTVTQSILDRFYKSYYVAENMMVVVVGDVDPEDVARRVELAFQDAPKGKAPTRARIIEKPLAGPQVRLLANFGDTEGTALTVGFRAPAWGTADALALDVLMALLVESPSSRAQKRMIEKGGEFVVAAAHRAFEADGGTVTVSVRAQPERMRDAEDALFALIEQSRSTPVTQEELDAAVASVLARDLYS